MPKLIALVAGDGLPYSDAIVAKGTLGGGAFETTDYRKTFEELSSKGVTFLQEPAERP